MLDQITAIFTLTLQPTVIALPTYGYFSALKTVQMGIVNNLLASFSKLMDSSSLLASADGLRDSGGAGCHRCQGPLC
jgi:hypothetical protein